MTKKVQVFTSSGTFNEGGGGSGDLVDVQVFTGGGTYRRCGGGNEIVIVTIGDDGQGHPADTDETIRGGGGTGETRIEYHTPSPTETVAIGSGGSGRRLRK